MATARAFNILGLSPYVTYEVRVRAYTGVQENDWTAAIAQITNSLGKHSFSHRAVANGSYVIPPTPQGYEPATQIRVTLQAESGNPGTSGTDGRNPFLSDTVIYQPRVGSRVGGARGQNGVAGSNGRSANYTYSGITHIANGGTGGEGGVGGSGSVGVIDTVRRIDSRRWGYTVRITRQAVPGTPGQPGGAGQQLVHTYPYSAGETVSFNLPGRDDYILIETV